MKQNIHKISDSLTALLDEVETLLKESAQGVKVEAGHVDAKARETLHRVCGHLRNARSEIVDRVHKVDASVRSHPWEAIALTAVVSFFAGLLVRCR